MELWPIANGWQICCFIEARGWKQWKKLQNDLIELMKRSLDKRFQTIDRETVYAKNILTLQPSEEVIWIHWRKVKGNKWHVLLLRKIVCFKVEKIFLQEKKNDFLKEALWNQCIPHSSINICALFHVELGLHTTSHPTATLNASWLIEFATG